VSPLQRCYAISCPRHGESFPTRPDRGWTNGAEAACEFRDGLDQRSVNLEDLQSWRADRYLP
jgi:hypothetical protein